MNAKIVLNGKPAERLRGLTFYETFEDQTSVDQTSEERNGGVMLE